MRRREFLLSLGGTVVPLPFPLSAQQKPPTIGFLGASTASNWNHWTAAFVQRLRELGWIEGRTLAIEYRWAEGQSERFDEFAAEFVRLKVDVIVSGGPATTPPVKEATSSIPIVMAQDNDPVATGVISSLARRGGNITGLSTLAPEISGKRLELLQEIIPKFSRVAPLGSSTMLGQVQMLKEVEAAAGALKAKLQYLDVLDAKDIETAFKKASKGRSEADLVLQSAVMSSHRKQPACIGR